MSKKEKEKKVKNSKKGLFHDIKMEMKKVKWPTFKEIVKYTIATLAVCIIIAFFFIILNILISLIKGAF